MSMSSLFSGSTSGSRLRAWRQSLLLLVLAGSALAGHSMNGPEPLQPSQRLGFAQFMPQTMGEWQRRPEQAPVDMPESLQINELFQAMYLHPEFGRYAITMEYTADSRRRYELHYPDICHTVRGDRVVIYPPWLVGVQDLDPIKASLMEWEHPSGRNRALTAYWYVNGDGVTSDTARIKLNQALAGLMRKPEASVMFRVDAFFERDLNPARKRELLSGVTDLIQSLRSELEESHSKLIFRNL
jgi:hypothetical protein